MDFISNIPFEILETILMFAVSSAPPPIKAGSHTGRPFLRWEQDLRSGESILVQLLSPRLVSSRFHSASWRPFAQILGEVMFDLRSRDSLANLMAVSSCKSLAPWITKLTIGFYGPPRGLRYDRLGEETANDLGSAGQEVLRRIYDVEMSWWPDELVWEEDNTPDHGMACPHYQPSGAGWCLDTVVRCLRAMKNLDDVCYSFDTRILPARYKPVLQHLSKDSAVDLSPKLTAKLEQRAHRGLDFLLEALAVGNVAPRRLDISTPQNGEHVVATTPLETLQRVCRRVADLTIRSSRVEEYDPRGILLYCNKDVETLSIIINNEDERSLIPTQTWSDLHLKHLAKDIAAFQVKRLRIQIGTDGSWAHTDYKRWHQSDLLELQGKPAGWLDGVADVVQFRPQGLRAYLKRYGAWTGACCEWDGE